MKFVPVLIVACVLSQAALAEGLECHRVADPTPRLSCIEKPTTAEVPTPQRPDAWSPPDPTRRNAGSGRDTEGAGIPSTRVCRNC